MRKEVQYFLPLIKVLLCAATGALLAFLLVFIRHLGERLHAAGANVLSLRVPGHETGPSGLVEVSWQDMASAVWLAVRNLPEYGPFTYG